MVSNHQQNGDSMVKHGKTPDLSDFFIQYNPRIGQGKRIPMDTCIILRDLAAGFMKSLPMNQFDDFNSSAGVETEPQNTWQGKDLNCWYSIGRAPK